MSSVNMVEAEFSTELKEDRIAPNRTAAKKPMIGLGTTAEAALMEICFHPGIIIVIGFAYLLIEIASVLCFVSLYHNNIRKRFDRLEVDARDSRHKSGHKEHTREQSANEHKNKTITDSRKKITDTRT